MSNRHTCSFNMLLCWYVLISYSYIGVFFYPPGRTRLAFLSSLALLHNVEQQQTEAQCDCQSVLGNLWQESEFLDKNVLTQGSPVCACPKYHCVSFCPDFWEFSIVLSNLCKFKCLTLFCLPFSFCLYQLKPTYQSFK